MISCVRRKRELTSSSKFHCTFFMIRTIFTITILVQSQMQLKHPFSRNKKSSEFHKIKVQLELFNIEI